jgi:hypothetical protein
MEDLIKVAHNGQWILEKAKPTDEEQRAQVEAFLAQKKAQAANPAPAAPAPGSPTMRQNSTAGLRPVQQQGGENPSWSKEQVAAFRAGIPANIVDKARPPAPGQTAQEKHVGKVTADIERGQQEADEKAKITQGRKAAWQATAKFLAQHGSKGMQALHAQMQQRQALDAAHEAKSQGKTPEPVRPRPLPPQEPFVNDQGVRSMRERQGTFHNEGAVTAGKIRSKGVAYPDKQTGEIKYTSVPQQEQHHWAWDHNNKKWNHVKTTLGKATI